MGLDGYLVVSVPSSGKLYAIGDNVARQALAEPHTRPFDFTGKPMRRTINVAPEGIASEEDLAGWVDAGADYASSLPAK